MRMFPGRTLLRIPGVELAVHQHFKNFPRNLVCQRLRGDVDELAYFLRNAQVLQRSSCMRASFAVDAAGSRLH